MQTTGMLALVLMVFLASWSYTKREIGAGKDLSDAETQSMWYRLPSVLVFIGCAAIAFNANATDYWAALESVGIASMAIVTSRSETNEMSPVNSQLISVLSAACTFRDSVCRYFGVAALALMLLQWFADIDINTDSDFGATAVIAQDGINAVTTAIRFITVMCFNGTHKVLHYTSTTLSKVPIIFGTIFNKFELPVIFSKDRP